MNEFINRWNFVRSETLEILSVLTDEQLLFTPHGDNWQPLYYQFACIARTQRIYASAAKAGVMDFSLFSSPDMPNKSDYRTKESLQQFLNDSNEQWLAVLNDGKQSVDWGGESKSLSVHLMSLAEHERLHHGQLISYFTLAGIDLPAGFKQNWAL